jgi:hypothetical protein
MMISHFQSLKKFNFVTYNHNKIKLICLQTGLKDAQYDNGSLLPNQGSLTEGEASEELTSLYYLV